MYVENLCSGMDCIFPILLYYDSNLEPAFEMNISCFENDQSFTPF
jgi:hypothetical protein